MRTVLLPALLALPALLPAQGGDDRRFADRLWFGGNMWLSFGTFTMVQLDPMVGYRVDPGGRFIAGTGPSFWYLEDRRFKPKYTYTGYGYRIFSRYRVIDQAFLHAEFLHFNVDGARNELVGPVDKRFWVPHLLVGGGYLQRTGGRGGLYIQVLFELLQDPNSIYYGMGPIISIGGGVGF
jgi:hypothetical protein